MKRPPYFSNFRLSLIVIGVMLIITSCKELAQPNIPPAAEEVPAPSNFDPSMELSSKYLICPTVPNTAPVIPAGPFDEQIGDCALRGKSVEIEAWLTALEQIANSCLANRETNWAATLAARDYLDTRVNKIGARDEEITQTIDIEEEEEKEEYSTGAISGSRAGPSTGIFDVENCGVYETRESIQEIDENPSSSHKYTDKLIRIRESVVEYCTLIDELIKPLWQACDEINFYQDCQVPNLQQYHAIIEQKMNLAQANYEQTSLFYTNTLQNDGWDDFRSSFDAASLNCPPIQAFSSPPSFTFSMNTFCRRGPSSEYEEVATFLEGQVVEIVGRNHHQPRWWWVPNPGERGNCWVSDSTGAAEGPVEEVEIIAPPPLVINQPKNDQPKCSKDLGKSACKAAGGKWVAGAVGAPYCDCK